jgi:hypothetical protein
MLYYDVLDELAEAHIPCTEHELLHVNPRTAWVETVMELIEKGQIKGKKSELLFYAKYWEPLLFKKYSTLN